MLQFNPICVPYGAFILLNNFSVALLYSSNSVPEENTTDKQFIVLLEFYT